MSTTMEHRNPNYLNRKWTLAGWWTKGGSMGHTLRTCWRKINTGDGIGPWPPLISYLCFFFYTQFLSSFQTLGLCLPVPKSLKTVLKKSSALPVVLSLGFKLDALFQAEQLPEDFANLETSLANMDEDSLSHSCSLQEKWQRRELLLTA